MVFTGKVTGFPASFRMFTPGLKINEHEFIWLVVSNMFYFPFHIWDVILPIDELIFFKMVIAPPTIHDHQEKGAVSPKSTRLIFCARAPKVPSTSVVTTCSGVHETATGRPNRFLCIQLMWKISTQWPEVIIHVL